MVSLRGKRGGATSESGSSVNSYSCIFCWFQEKERGNSTLVGLAKYKYFTVSYSLLKVYKMHSYPTCLTCTWALSLPNFQELPPFSIPPSLLSCILTCILILLALGLLDPTPGVLLLPPLLPPLLLSCILTCILMLFALGLLDPTPGVLVLPPFPLDSFIFFGGFSGFSGFSSILPRLPDGGALVVEVSSFFSYEASKNPFKSN